MRQWCIEHDERVSFYVPYIVLSIVLSLVGGLFWLLALVVSHLALEFYRHREEPLPTLTAHAFWNVRLDLVLVLVAVTVTLYLETVLGVLGLRALPRAGAAASRLPSLQRVIRSAVLLTDEAVRVGAYFVALRGVSAPEESAAAAIEPPRRPWTPEAWTTGTWVLFGVTATMLFLIALAPWTTGQGVETVVTTLRAEFRPFP